MIIKSNYCSGEVQSTRFPKTELLHAPFSHPLCLSLSLPLSLLGQAQALFGDSCDPLATTGSLDLNPCGLVANSVFNDKFVVQSAPDPYDSSLPYEYMDESEISWVTGELSNSSYKAFVATRARVGVEV